MKQNLDGQVKHAIPRGEIKHMHGRQMKSSKTNVMNNSKHIQALIKPQKRQFEGAKQGHQRVAR